MNEYQILKEKQSAEFNTLPLKAAFGDEQFKRMMAEWNLSTNDEDLKKIYSLGCGAYCLVTDVHLFAETSERHKKEMKDFLSTDKGLKDAFMYEFGNYECGYTYTPQDAIVALGFTRTEVENDKRLNKIFKEAWNEYIDKCE